MSTAVARLVLIAAIPGVAAVILPFTYDTSPLDGILDGELWSLALPFFAAPIGGLVAVRVVLVGRLSPIERTGAHLVAFVAGAATLRSLWMVFSGSSASSRDFRFWTAVAALAVVLALGVMEIVRVRRSDVSVLTPLVGWIAPFLANAIFCLVSFAGHWQAGAYCALVAAVLHVAAIARLMGQAGEPGSSVVGSPAPR